MEPYLFKIDSTLSRRFPWTRLIKAPTPVYRLEALARHWGTEGLWIKREDQTHPAYGGNKVRNLEFILGKAVADGAESVVTLVPYGSNFTAALSAHAPGAGLQVHLSQFVAQRNLQIERHALFCRDLNARSRTFGGPLGVVGASLEAVHRKATSGKRGGCQWIPPGASNVRGALGHVNALFELSHQLKDRSECPPHVIVVGAGTCGTIAGLTAGCALLGWPTEIIGIRCAEPLVCNRFRVMALARRLCRTLGRVPKGALAVRLVDLPTRSRYAVPCPSSYEVMKSFWELEGVSLDTTYTAKVGLYLQTAAQNGAFRKKRVLYWHTYSPAALSWDSDHIIRYLSTGVTVG
jgi:D-cysteine desulfhydrase